MTSLSSGKFLVVLLLLEPLFGNLDCLRISFSLLCPRRRLYLDLTRKGPDQIEKAGGTRLLRIPVVPSRAAAGAMPSKGSKYARAAAADADEDDDEEKLPADDLEPRAPTRIVTPAAIAMQLITVVLLLGVVMVLPADTLEAVAAWRAGRAPTPRISEATVLAAAEAEAVRLLPQKEMLLAAAKEEEGGVDAPSELLTAQSSTGAQPKASHPWEPTMGLQQIDRVTPTAPGVHALPGATLEGIGDVSISPGNPCFDEEGRIHFSRMPESVFKKIKNAGCEKGWRRLQHQTNDLDARCTAMLIDYLYTDRGGLFGTWVALLNSTWNTAQTTTHAFALTASPEMYANSDPESPAVISLSKLGWKHTTPLFLEPMQSTTYCRSSSGKCTVGEITELIKDGGVDRLAYWTHAVGLWSFEWAGGYRSQATVASRSPTPAPYHHPDCEPVPMTLIRPQP